MKRIMHGLRTLFLAITFLLPIFCGTSTVAADVDVETKLSQAVVFYLGSPIASVRNTLQRIDEVSPSVHPVAESGRTLLPVRFLAESLGAVVQWLGPEQTALITTDDVTIRIPLDTYAMEVNGVLVPLDVPARITDNRILVPMRAISEALGQKVDWHTGGLIIVSQTENLLNPIADAVALEEISTRFRDPITYRKTEIKTASGVRTVHVTHIRPDDPRVRFEVALPETTLARTADFSSIAAARGARIAINGNLFRSGNLLKDPIGHVMIDGELVYGESGLTSIGITRNKKVLFGQPGIFTRLFADGIRTNAMAPGGQVDYHAWVAYEVNTLSQSEKAAIVYTPRRGREIAFTANGHVVTVRAGKIAALTPVNPSTILPIPSDGYLVFFGASVTKEWIGDWDLDIGRPVEMEHYLFSNPTSTFSLEGMQWMMSGGPDLVRNGMAAPVPTSILFTNARFTTDSAPRTAIGIDLEGNIILVSTPFAKIADMKEIMLSLECEQAISLDGGGSTGLYYDGSTLMKPGRPLTTMFFVYDW